jgi:hypothetical protein
MKDPESQTFRYFPKEIYDEHDWGDAGTPADPFSSQCSSVTAVALVR